MKLTKYGPRTMESGSSGDHYTVMDVRPDGEWLKAADVEAWLRPIVEKWERQTNARESVTFRLAMKALKADLDALRGGG